MRLSRRNALRAGGSVAAGLALAGCSGSSDDGDTGSPTGTASGTGDGSSVSEPTRDGEWPQDGYDAANSNATDASVSGAVSEQWRVAEFSGGGYDPGTVRIHQGVVMVSTADGMFAYDAGTGSELWQSDVGYDNHVAIDGTVYQGTLTDDGEEVVAAYSVADGSRTGELAVEGEAANPLAVDENHVYAPISVGDGTELAAIDRDLNEIVWRASYESSYNPYISPAVGDGVVYNVQHLHSESEVVAYDADTGEQLWTNRSTGVETGPIVGAGAVYTGQVAIDAATGEERWTADVEPSGTVRPGSVTDEAVLYGGSGITADEESLQAIDPDTGDRRWRRTWDSVGNTVIGNGTVYVAHTGGVSALSLSDGETEWTTEALEPGSMQVLEEMLVVIDGSDVAAYTP